MFEIWCKEKSIKMVNYFKKYQRTLIFIDAIDIICNTGFFEMIEILDIQNMPYTKICKLLNYLKNETKWLMYILNYIKVIPLLEFLDLHQNVIRCMLLSSHSNSNEYKLYVDLVQFHSKKNTQTNFSLFANKNKSLMEDYFNFKLWKPNLYNIPHDKDKENIFTMMMCHNQITKLIGLKMPKPILYMIINMIICDFIIIN